MGERFFPQEKNKVLERKIYWFFAIITGVLFLLLLRAWDLQVTNETYYLKLSENNRLRMVETPAPRGRIYDRNGALLVNNVPGFSLYLVRADMQDQEAVIGRLSQFTEIKIEEILDSLKNEIGDPYRPIKIKSDLSLKEVAQIEGHSLSLPGVKIEAEFKRHAVSGSLAAHLLGYVGEITRKQLEKEQYSDIKSGTIIGQFGIEQNYDALLQGVPGTKRIEVDALGHERQVVKEVFPQQGNDLFLTLDLKLQKAAEAALAGRPGVIIALDPHNGEVLAMVSHPAFDPNLISKGASSTLWQALLNDEARPLTNRAIQGQYPPGSTFKIVMASALLETQSTTADDEINCRGSLQSGERHFRDWKQGGHGPVDLYRSLVESCDVYYYIMGQKLGVDRIAKYSKLFGLGRTTGIDLAFENSGLIPTKAWKKKTLKEAWYTGETLSVSIGQGFVTATPLQLATMVAALAADGHWYRPHLLKKTRDIATGDFTTMNAEKGHRLPVSKERLAVIRTALAGVVTDPLGTAKGIRSNIVSIAGKTGTAQVIAMKADEDIIEGGEEEIPEAFRDHAWFVAFAPVETPRLAIVVLLEHGGHGGSAAAPLAKAVIESYFEKDGRPGQGNETQEGNDHG